MRFNMRIKSFIVGSKGLLGFWLAILSRRRLGRDAASREWFWRRHRRRSSWRRRCRFHDWANALGNRQVSNGCEMGHRARASGVIEDIWVGVNEKYDTLLRKDKIELGESQFAWVMWNNHDAITLRFEGRFSPRIDLTWSLEIAGRCFKTKFRIWNMTLMTQLNQRCFVPKTCFWNIYISSSAIVFYQVVVLLSSLLIFVESTPHETTCRG